jgi:hypothetical protein
MSKKRVAKLKGLLYNNDTMGDLEIREEDDFILLSHLIPYMLDEDEKGITQAEKERRKNFKEKLIRRAKALESFYRKYKDIVDRDEKEEIYAD